MNLTHKGYAFQASVLIMKLEFGQVDVFVIVIHIS